METEQDLPPNEPAQQEPRKFAGKYESTEALEQGYLHANRENANLARELRESRDRNRQLETLFVQRPGGEAQPSQAMEKLAEAGVPIEAFQAALTEMVGQAVQQRMAPIVRSAEAASLVPDASRASSYLREHSDVRETYQALVNTDASNAAQVAANYLDAMMGRQEAERTEATLQEGDAAARADRGAQRRDATVMVSRPDARKAAESGAAKNEKLDALQRHGMDTNDYKPYVKEALKDLEVWWPGAAAPTKTSQG